MKKTAIIIIFSALSVVCNLALGADNAVAHWKFDEGGGGIAGDSSGNGNDGTITGAAWFDDPRRGMCVHFDSNDDCVKVINSASMQSIDGSAAKYTISLWVRTTQSGASPWNQKAIFERRATDELSGKNHWVAHIYLNGYDAAGFLIGDGSEQLRLNDTLAINNDHWHHIAVTRKGTDYARLYVDGSLRQSGSTAANPSTTEITTMGIRRNNADFQTGSFRGKVDDVRVYTRALSAEEIERLFLGEYNVAFGPNPIDGATGVEPDVVLSWLPGDCAVSHDVYFGTNFNDVNDADVNSPEYMGNFDVNYFDLGGLDFSTTYYWRVDEVNEPNLWKGDVWSFEIGSPAIEFSAAQFEFTAFYGGANPDDQVLGISNSGVEVLNWQISEDCDWLSVEPNSGSSTGEIDDVDLSVDISGLPAGIYTCNLTVSAPNAVNSPQIIWIYLFVDAGDILLVPAEYETIQAAIDASINGDTVIVAPGTYTGPGNWDIDFLGKAITVRSIDPTDPLIVADTVVNCSGADYAYSGFNFENDEDANSVLDGFTITGAGEAISCRRRTSPTIKNCVITENYSFHYGAIRCDGSPTIANCTITDNRCSGIYCCCGCPKIANCTIARNTGGDDLESNGGGIYCNFAQMVITNCTITEHTVDSWGGGGIGGGIYAESSNLIIKNCIISGNTAGEHGGGIFWVGHNGDCSYDPDIDCIASEITGCTIADNSAGDNGGGIFFGGYTSAPITNSIIWGNSDSSGSGLSAQIYDGSPIYYGSLKVWFSCIQDDNPDDANVPFGEDRFNIDDDPCFVEADGDYHLLADSPCIEAGDPYISFVGDTDIDGQPRRMGPRVDIGADEFELSAVIVTKPQGGEVWATGSKHEIKWDSYDINGTVDIYYSDTNGADWVMIDNAPDTGSYFWHLPQMVNSNQCLIAVEPNVIPPDLILVESKPFTIHPYWHWPPPTWWPGYPFMKSGPRYGCVKWKFQTDGPITAGIAVGCNRLYVPSEDGKLYALDALGRLVWTYDTNSPLVGSPAVSRNGAVYVGAENGKLYAFGKWGRLLWTHTTDKPIYSSPTVSADGDIYVSSLDGKLYALAPDGSELWTFQTGGISPAAGGAIFASPAIDPNGTVYIAGLCDPNLYALDSNDGTVKWSRTFLHPCTSFNTHRRTWPLASPVVAADGVIYQTLLYDPNLYAIDPNDGQLIWSTHLADPCSGWFEPNYINQHTYWDGYPPPYMSNFNRYASSWSKPALAPDGTVYVSFDDPYLRAVDLDGNIKWVTRLGMMGGFTLAVGGNGLIYAACDDGTLYVVDPNGQEISRFEGSGGLSFPTITAGRTVIVSDSDNTVWAISRRRCWHRPLALHRPEDLNGDRTVNITDLAALAAGWLDRTDTCWPCAFEQDQVYPEGDIDKSLYTDFADFAQLANQWLN